MPGLRERIERMQVAWWQASGALSYIANFVVNYVKFSLNSCTSNYFFDSIEIVFMEVGNA